MKCKLLIPMGFLVSGINEEAHIFFLLLIRTGQHLSIYMTAHSGYQISNIDIFLDVAACVLVYTEMVDAHPIIFIFKTTQQKPNCCFSKQLGYCSCVTILPMLILTM